MEKYINVKEIYRMFDKSGFARLHVSDIDVLTPADVISVVPGKWQWITEDIYECSICHDKNHVKEVMNEPVFAYCPSCGAKMAIEV